jgi:hypothetical protein
MLPAGLASATHLLYRELRSFLHAGIIVVVLMTLVAPCSRKQHISQP